jgi:hypothetical protein
MGLSTSGLPINQFSAHMLHNLASSLKELARSMKLNREEAAFDATVNEARYEWRIRTFSINVEL